jgi:hypothetical protein
MRGVIPLLPLCTFIVWTGIALPLAFHMHDLHMINGSKYLMMVILVFWNNTLHRWVSSTRRFVGVVVSSSSGLSSLSKFTKDYLLNSSRP